MTKAEIVAKISEKLGVDKTEVQNIVEHFMDGIKDSLESGDMYTSEDLVASSLRLELKRQGVTFPKTLPLLSLHIISQLSSQLKYLYNQ